MKYVAEGTDSSDSEYVFKLKTENAVQNPTVKVRLLGVKGLMDADSCSTANIIDEERFKILQAATEQHIQIKDTQTKLYAYAQSKPVPLIGSFEGEIESVTTGKHTKAEFLIVKGKTKARPLLSLDTSIKLGVIHLTNTVSAPEPTLITTGSTDDKKIDTLINQYHDIFEGLGEHKSIKAKLIIDENVQPIAHKRRRIPYN